ncbi:ATP-binding protein [Streptomyces sp. PTM05]|uniref:ATP-binding protein n=1 Tax=Streptantibioticus parmotrematis TaxID=2873249 RepID=A0ABS7QVN7_9ACTN|nr:ATP-binding protein [Streptantibioticus parmotrematis]MBY8887272.1 ATP-binding protein [Streptantibioticus parmotrematis]
MASMTATSTTVMTGAFETVFAPEQSRVADMRHLSESFLELWRVPGSLAESVVLVVSELVTNSIEHGWGDVGVRVRCEQASLTVEVTDSNPAPARLRVADDDALDGRGLLLVQVVADAWGVSRDGTTTWATWRLNADSRVAAAGGAQR